MNCNVGRDFFERFKIIFVYDDTVLNAIDSQIWVAAIELFLKKKKLYINIYMGLIFFLIPVELICSVLLVSGIPNSDSIILYVTQCSSQ